MKVPYDTEQRLRRRILNIVAAQSTPAFLFYMQAVDSGAAPELIPPDPYDLDISVRQWKRLVIQYHKELKKVASERNSC